MKKRKKKSARKEYKNEDIKPLRETEEKAQHLLRYIWNAKINHSFWNWWLFSPKYLWRWLKRIIFGALSSFLSFMIILPFINSISFFKLKISTPEWSYWVASIIAIFFILLSPLLARIKAGGEVDIELSPPSEITMAPVSLMLIMEEAISFS